MKIYVITLCVVLPILYACKEKTSNQTQSPIFPMIPIQVPETSKDSISDAYHGTDVPDPYRWLEDDHSDRTKNWVLAQNQVTFSYLDKISFRKDVRNRIEELFNFERCTAPDKMGNRYFFFRNNGLQNQDVLYTSTQLKDSQTVLLDPNQFSKDGTVALGGISASKDGKYFAYQISVGGSDWNKILIKDLSTLQHLTDTIDWVKFSNIAWHNDGFYYSRYPTPKGSDVLSGKNENHSLYFHKVGTKSTEDKLIYEDKKFPLRNVFAETSEDERFLICSESESTSGNAFRIADLQKQPFQFIPVVKEFSNDYTFIGNVGDLLYFHTNANAPNWRVIALDIKNPNISQSIEIIPSGKDRLQSVNLIGQKLVCSYLHNASSDIKMFDVNGKLLHQLTLPELGTVDGITGQQNDDEAFYSFSSFIRPSTIYKLNLKDYSTEIYFAPKLDFNPDLYTTEQVWFPSKDQTFIPMFLTYKKGLKKNGHAPTLLYGYGGFDISILPTFSVSRTILLENDGIYAVANIRGGGEFGKEWHTNGTKEKKQNVFDDFISAAEFLINEKYTDKDHLAIEGRSNGGLLVGACMTQRPDLFKVAFPGVGVLDMLRYHKFTIGWAWASDYGTSETKEGFDYLIKYSPLHNCRPAQYPATLIITADHDDRVVPAHSFKFASALQAAQQGNNPTLIRVDVSAGHGAGKPTSKKIDEAADILSFMFYNMNINPIVKK